MAPRRHSRSHVAAGPGAVAGCAAMPAADQPSVNVTIANAAFFISISLITTTLGEYDTTPAFRQ